MKTTKNFFSFFILVNLILLTTLAKAASFDCRKASTSVEKIICSSPSLSKLDSELSEIYKEAVGKEPSIKRDQIDWLRERNKCQNESCLESAYNERKDDLVNFIVRFDRRALTEDSSRVQPNNGDQANKFVLSTQDKEVIQRLHDVAMCAGFYSRYLPRASISSCDKDDVDSVVQCYAWFSNDQYRKILNYNNLEARGFPAGLANYIRSNKSNFDRSYVLGKNNYADNKTSLACKAYLDSYSR